MTNNNSVTKPIGKENYIHLHEGKLAQGANSYTYEDFTNLIHSLRKSNQKTLVLHFHGGLVDFKTAIHNAEENLPKYESSGAYPVFFLWESGLLTTLGDVMDETAKECIFDILLGHIAQFILAKIKVSNKSRGPLELPSDSDIYEELKKREKGEEPFCNIEMPPLLAETFSKEQEKQFKERLDQDENLSEEIQRIIERLSSNTDIAGQTLLSKDIIDNLRKNQQKSGIKNSRSLIDALTVLRRVLSRLFKGTDHGIYTTIVEELIRVFFKDVIINLGEKVWDQMKEYTADSFNGYGTQEEKKYGGTLFLEAIKNMWTESYKPRIILIGHSAGAVYICNWLQAAQKQKLPDDLKFEVIFLAPACTFELFARTLNQCKSRIANFRLFALNDERERKDQIIPILYPHSLLYCISGLLEKSADMPLVGMQRYYKGKKPYDNNDIKQVLDYVKENWRVWSPQQEGPDGFKSDAKEHGGFDTKDKPTLESIKHIIKKGF